MSGCRVVGIDDERLGRLALQAVLKAERCDGTVVETPAELEAAVTRGPCDLVLLDLMMPGLDGFALCRRLRAGWPALSATPILIVTALDDDPALVREAMEAGADGVLSKPLSRPALREWLATPHRREQAHGSR